MPVSIFDLVVLGVILISALLAAVRGFTREILSIASWVAAVAAALAFHPALVPYVQQHITNPQIALAVAIGAIFLVTLVVVSFLTVRLSDFVLDSRIGALDRSLGFFYGAARGVLICIVGFLMFNWLVKPEMQPEWARTAKTRSFLQQGGDQLLAMLPDDPEAALRKLKPPTQDQPAPEAPSEDPSLQPGGQRRS